MSEMSPSETPVNENGETPNWALKQFNQTLDNFSVLASMYEDKQYLEELEPYLRDKEDLKRIIHALLLCEGSKGGWTMEQLKTRVKEMKGFKDTKDVDKFVKEQFHYDTFDQLIKKAKDIAKVDEDGSVHPVLDDTNREIYEDAVASVKNKDDKERKKDERLARSLEDPNNIVGFFRGVNRIRKAILNTLENFRETERENALSEISEKIGTASTVIGVNYNFVCTEYERLYDTKLDDKECKSICGRSTLAKGLNQGQGPQCLIDTITMENKCGDDGKGMYIGLKSGAREFSEEEIQHALDECVKRNSNKQHRIKKWEDRDAKYHRGDVAKDVFETNKDRLRSQLSQQLESHRSASASDTPPSTPHSPDAPVDPAPPARASVPEPAPAPVPPANQPTAANVEWDTRQLRETQPQAAPPSPSTLQRSERERRARELQDADSDELHSEDGYSDEDEEDKEKRESGNELKRIERQRRDKGRQSDDDDFRGTFHPTPPAAQRSPSPVQQPPAATPSPSPMVVHEEVPYGELPPAPHVIHHPENDEMKDEIEAEEALNQALASASASRLTPIGARHNKWEEEDEPAASVDRRLFTPPPEVQPPAVQQAPLRMAPTTGRGVFDPQPIPQEAYQQPAYEQPLEQLQPSYEEQQRAYEQEQQQQQYDQRQMQYSPAPPAAPYEDQQQPSYSTHQTQIPPQDGGMNPPMQPLYQHDQQPQEYPPSSQNPHYSPVFPPQQQAPQGYLGPNSRQSTPSQPQFDPEATAASYSQHTYSQGPYQQYPHDGSPMHPDPQYPPVPPPQPQYQQPLYSPYPQQQPQYPPAPVYPNGAPAPNQSGYGHPGYVSDRTPSPVINVFNHIAPTRAGSEYNAPPSALPSHDPRHGVPPPTNPIGYPPQQPSHYGAHPGAPRDQWQGHGASTPVDEYSRPHSHQSAPAPRSGSGGGGERFREEPRRGDRSYEEELQRRIRRLRELAELEEELERERNRRKEEDYERSRHPPPSSSHHGRPRGEGQLSTRRRGEERSTPSPLGDAFDHDEYQRSMQRQMPPPSRGFGMSEEERRRNEGRGNRSREEREYHHQPPSRAFGDPNSGREDREYHQRPPRGGFGDPNSGMRTDRSYEEGGYDRGYASGRGPSPRDDRERRDAYRDSGFGRRETREPPNTRPPRVLENPVAASTPLNRSRDESLWGFFHQLQSPKERIRWQVISIVKCIMDQNRRKLNEGNSHDYQLIELDHMMSLVERGCGNDMELFNATAEYLNSSNPFYQFLREMARDNLIAMYTGQLPTGKMNSTANTFFIVDPFTSPPAHFGLRKVQA